MTLIQLLVVVVAVHEPAVIRDMMVMKNFTMLKMFLSAVSAGESLSRGSQEEVSHCHMGVMRTGQSLSHGGHEDRSVTVMGVM